MKTHLIALLMFAGPGFGQGLHDSGEAKMTLDHFHARLSTADTGYECAELARSVFRSQDLELIRICFTAPNMYGNFMLELEKLPAEDFKKKIIQVILQEPWLYDKMPNGMRPPLTPPPFGLEAICLSVLEEMLPEEGLAGDAHGAAEKLRDPESRKRLSQLLGNRLGLSTGQGQGGDKPGQPAHAGKDSSRSDPALTDGYPTPRQALSTESKSTPTGRPGSSTPWLIIPAVLVAAGTLLWLLLKRRSQAP